MELAHLEELEMLQEEGENLRKFNVKEEIKIAAKEHYEDLRVEFLSENNLTIEEMSTVNKVFNWLKIKA